MLDGFDRCSKLRACSFPAGADSLIQDSLQNAPVRALGEVFQKHKLQECLLNVEQVPYSKVVKRIFWNRSTKGVKISEKTVLQVFQVGIWSEYFRTKVCCTPDRTIKHFLHHTERGVWG